MTGSARVLGQISDKSKLGPTSPPIAKVIADSEILRAIVRVALVPFIGWAALILWSPTLGLGIAFVILGVGAWPRMGTGRGRPLTEKRVEESRRTALWRRLTLWGFVFLGLSTAALLEAVQEDRSQEVSRVQVAVDVQLPQATRFALVRDPKTAHLGLDKDGEAIFEGENPLPLGKIVRVHDQNLVIALPSGETVEIPQGGKLPGPRGLIFVESALFDTLRFQIRFGPATAPNTSYAVVNIRGRRAILERDATLGEIRAASGLPAIRGP